MWPGHITRQAAAALMLTASCTWAITPGDPRDGYEHADYETASRGLSAQRGSALALAELAGNPPLGLPPLPAERLPAAAAIDLGRRLFFDRRLSANATLSCACLLYTSDAADE